MSLLIMDPGNKVHNTMCKAIYSCDIDKVSAIIDEFGVSYCPNWCGGSSLLLTAIDCRYANIAQLLVAKGCSLLGPFSKSLIHIAVKLGDAQLINDMLEKKNDLIKVMENGETVLHVTAAGGKGALLRQLIKKGAELEKQNRSGMTALHLAAVHGHVEVLTILLQAGASVKTKDVNGKTALFLATSSGQREATHVLLEWGSDCNVKNNNGSNPLIDLTNKGFSSCIDIFRDLVAYGANMNNPDSNGQTPLHIAVMRKDIAMMDEILEGGGDVNATDKNGMAACDAVTKISLMGMTFFKDSRVAFVLGKFLMKINEVGFHLNGRNRTFLDMFINIYNSVMYDHLGVGHYVGEDKLALQIVLKSIQEEVALMKTTQGSGGISVFSILEKFKNSNTLNSMTQREVRLLESIDMTLIFPFYRNILKIWLRTSKRRNELINSGQESLSIILTKSESSLPTLPEEVISQVMSFLTNDDLLRLIKCRHKIGDCRDGNSSDGQNR